MPGLPTARCQEAASAAEGAANRKEERAKEAGDRTEAAAWGERRNRRL